jgi:hypothetical protein
VESGRGMTAAGLKHFAHVAHETSEPVRFYEVFDFQCARLSAMVFIEVVAASLVDA